MDNRLSGRLKIVNALLMIVLVCLWIAVVMLYVRSTEGKSSAKKVYINFEQITPQEKLDVDFPATLKTYNNKVILESQLTRDIVQSGGMGFHTRDVYVNAYLDGKPIYSNLNVNNFGESVEIGRVWNHIEFDEYNDKLKNELRIVLEPVSQKNSVDIEGIYLGNQKDVFTKAMWLDYYMYIIMILLVMFGAFILFFRYVYRNSIGMNRAVGMLGAGSVFAAMAVFSFSNIVAFDFMSGYSLRIINFVSIIMSITAIQGYVVQNETQKSRLPMMILMGINIFLCGYFALDHVTLPRQIAPYEHNTFIALLIAGLLYSIFMLEKDFFVGNKNVRVLFISLCVLTVSVIFDIMVGYALDMKSPFISLILTTVFFLANSVYEINYIANHYEWAELMNYYQDLARTDQMTGLRNRVYFSEDVVKFRANTDNATVIYFDVDNLKYVNDTYGHAVGDDMIITAADIIIYCFAEKGYCYRMSGDEFLCVTYENIGKIRERIEEFKEAVSLTNSKKSYKFRVSIGMATFEGGLDKTFDDVMSHAEKNMYIDKRSSKRRRRA